MINLDQNLLDTIFPNEEKYTFIYGGLVSIIYFCILIISPFKFSEFSELSNIHELKFIINNNVHLVFCFIGFSLIMTGFLYCIYLLIFLVIRSCMKIYIKNAYEEYCKNYKNSDEKTPISKNDFYDNQFTLHRNLIICSGLVLSMPWPIIVAWKFCFDIGNLIWFWLGITSFIFVNLLFILYPYYRYISIVNKLIKDGRIEWIDS